MVGYFVKITEHGVDGLFFISFPSLPFLVSKHKALRKKGKSEVGFQTREGAHVAEEEVDSQGTWKLIT